MKDQVEEVKSKIDIVSLINEHVPLQKSGRNFRANCPFHAEKTPSFMVSQELQIFKCFGCGEGGDVFSFLEKYEGMDFPEALKFLADRAGIKLKPLSDRAFSQKDKLYRINDLAAEFYHWVLLNHPEGKDALKYLTSQRALTPETIEEFKLGFAPERPDALSNFLIKKKGFLPKDLEDAGVSVFVKGRLIDRFRGRVIFPIHDHRGNPVALGGRITPNLSKNLAKYINSPETLIYHKSSILYGLESSKRHIKKAALAYIVEGEMDFLSSWQAGVKNIVAIKGSALTAEQVRILSRIAEEVVLALDSDLAGDAAARKGIDVAQTAGLAVKVARLAKYKDPDDFARADPEGFAQALAGAIDVWQFIIDSIFSKYDSKTGGGKAKLSREVMPVLSSISDKIVQAHYLAVVARKLDTEVDVIAKQMESVLEKTSQDRPELVFPKAPEGKTRRDLLEERLLSLVFQLDPKLLNEEKIREKITSPLNQRIVEEFLAFAKKKGGDLSQFAKTLPEELVPGFSELILKDVGKVVDKEMAMVIHEIEVLESKEGLKKQGKLIFRLEEKQAKKKLKEANQKFSQMSEKLANLEEVEITSIIHKKVDDV